MAEQGFPEIEGESDFAPVTLASRLAISRRLLKGLESLTLSCHLETDQLQILPGKKPCLPPKQPRARNRNAGRLRPTSPSFCT
jgi:hypothetical protein